MVWSVSSSFDKQHSAPPHRCPSRSLFTPSATCHEQADICHVDAIFIGQQRSAYKLACWRFRSSVKLWDGRVSGREGLRAGVWGQECWLVFGPAGGAMLKVWRLGVSRLFAHRGTQRSAAKARKRARLQMGREALFNFQPSREVKQHCQGSVTQRYHCRRVLLNKRTLSFFISITNHRQRVTGSKTKSECSRLAWRLSEWCDCLRRLGWKQDSKIG